MKNESININDRRQLRCQAAIYIFGKYYLFMNYTFIVHKYMDYLIATQTSNFSKPSLCVPQKSGSSLFITNPL